MITAVQLRAGRAALDLSKTELAEICGLNPATIHRFEKQKGWVRGNSDSIFRVINALEERGVVFINGGAFVRENRDEQEQVKLAEAS